MYFSKSLFSFCSQIVSGLRHCHQHLIVHGDVKPANVIVSPLGICKLGDFGHSIDLRKLDETKSTHPPVDIVGTAAYAAPEVLRGSCPTPSSDMYSFGILLWQVETREIPFAGEHPHVIIYKASFALMRIYIRDRPESDTTDYHLIEFRAKIPGLVVNMHVKTQPVCQVVPWWKAPKNPFLAVDL